MNYVCSVETINKVLGYLGTRPYQEVFQLIQEIQDAAKPPVAPQQEQKEEE